MDELDLNINNYNFDDLLNLFHLNNNFTSQDLKTAKTIVYKVHPDKSGLNKDYFLFFSRAYKMLYKIHQFREGTSRDNSEHDEYSVIASSSTATENQKVLEQHKEYSEITHNPKAFNTWFNDLFEKAQLDKDDDGYGTWLKEDSKNVQNAANPTQMAEMIESRKKQEREKQMTLYNSFEPIKESMGETLIDSEGPQHYQSGLFSKLQYDDLKDAHDISVIPVTQDDFKSHKTFRNIDEMNRHRKMDEITANDNLTNHNEMLKSIEQQEKDASVGRYYDLMKQEEEQKKRNNKIWSQLKQLK